MDGIDIYIPDSTNYKSTASGANKILTISDILVQSLLLKPQTWSHPIAEQYIRNIYKQAFLCLALIMCTNSAKHRGNITHFNIYKINVGST